MLACITLARIAVLVFTPLDISPDEAHYWEWSRRLDWSYYSKGPLVALLIAGSTSLFGDTALAIRAPALVCITGVSLVFYLFIRSIHGARYALIGSLALLSLPGFFAQGYLMTPDAPLLLLWLLAIVSAYRAVTNKGEVWWLIAGLAAAGGVFSKYTALVLFPGMLLFLGRANKNALSQRSWCFYGGLGIFSCALVLPLVWNQQHSWVNASHNASHVVGKSGLEFNPLYLPELIGGQLGLVGPILFVLLALALRWGYHAWRSGNRASAVIAGAALPLTLVCVLVSCTKRVYANWPLPIYLSALVLLMFWCAENPVARRRWITRAISLNVVLLTLFHLPFFGVNAGIPISRLPTKKLVGWTELGQYVEEAKRDLESKSSAPLFVVSYEYGLASELAFYMPSHPQPLCWNAGERRMNQYDLWGGWEARAGLDALIVLKDPEQIESIQSRFRVVEPLPRAPLEISVGGVPLRHFQLYLGQGFNGSPPELPAHY